MNQPSLPRSAVLRVVRAVEAGAALPVTGASGDRDDQLVSLHDHWSRQLLSRIDGALELGADSLEASVAAAWRSVLRDQPRVYRLLEAEADNPALRASRRSLHASVAVAAGLATFDDPVTVSARAGAAFLGSAAARPVDVPPASRLARLVRRLWDGTSDPAAHLWAA